MFAPICSYVLPLFFHTYTRITDDYSWYVAHNLMEFLNWYHKNVNSIETEEDLQQLEITEPEDGHMWSNTDITPEDIKELGDYDECCRGGVGDNIFRFAIRFPPVHFLLCLLRYSLKNTKSLACVRQYSARFTRWI